jgi:hypothetical protein
LVAGRFERSRRIVAAHRAQADALEIEAGAKRRLADECDAAQERNEISSHGGDRSKFPNEKLAPASKELHDARLIRDAIAPAKRRRLQQLELTDP